MNGPKVEYHNCVKADLPRLLAELKQLAMRTRPQNDAQRDRPKELRQPCLVIRGK